MVILKRTLSAIMYWSYDIASSQKNQNNKENNGCKFSRNLSKERDGDIQAGRQTNRQTDLRQREK